MTDVCIFHLRVGVWRPCQSVFLPLWYLCIIHFQENRSCIHLLRGEQAPKCKIVEGKPLRLREINAAREHLRHTERGVGSEGSHPTYAYRGMCKSLLCGLCMETNWPLGPTRIFIASVQTGKTFPRVHQNSNCRAAAETQPIRFQQHFTTSSCDRTLVKGSKHWLLKHLYVWKVELSQVQNCWKKKKKGPLK